MKRKKSKKWKERKKKKRREMKIKKRTEERKEGFPIKDRKEVKRENKQFSINERKRTEISQSRLPLKIILDWQYPIPHEQRGKDQTPSLLSKNTNLEKILLVRDRTFDL